MYMSSVCGNKHKTQSILPASPDAHTLRPDAHILRSGLRHRCILPADRKYMACGGDAHIPRSTSRPSEALRSTSQQIVRISEFYVDFRSVLW